MKACCLPASHPLPLVLLHVRRHSTADRNHPACRAFASAWNHHPDPEPDAANSSTAAASAADPPAAASVFDGPAAASADPPAAPAVLDGPATPPGSAAVPSGSSSSVPASDISRNGAQSRGGQAECKAC